MRPSTEALVLHTWYVDLWDVRPDDNTAWSTTTLKNLVSFVERDRQAIHGRDGDSTNKQVRQSVLLCLSCRANSVDVTVQLFGSILRKLAPFTPFLPGQLEASDEEVQQFGEDDDAPLV